MGGQQRMIASPCEDFMCQEKLSLTHCSQTHLETKNCLKKFKRYSFRKPLEKVTSLTRQYRKWDALHCGSDSDDQNQANIIVFTACMSDFSDEEFSSEPNCNCSSCKYSRA